MKQRSIYGLLILLNVAISANAATRKVVNCALSTGALADGSYKIDVELVGYFADHYYNCRHVIKNGTFTNVERISVVSAKFKVAAGDKVAQLEPAPADTLAADLRNGITAGCDYNIDKVLKWITPGQINRNPSEYLPKAEFSFSLKKGKFLGYQEIDRRTVPVSEVIEKSNVKTFKKVPLGSDTSISCAIEEIEYTSDEERKEQKRRAQEDREIERCKIAAYQGDARCALFLGNLDITPKEKIQKISDDMSLLKSGAFYMTSTLQRHITYKEAMQICQELETGNGLNNWRLPTYKDVVALVGSNFAGYSYYHWTSTPAEGGHMLVFGGAFSQGPNPTHIDITSTDYRGTFDMHRDDVMCVHDAR